MDRNNYYGGESASLNLNQLFEKFYPSTKPPANLGQSRDYNVDLIPKFLMSSGLMVKFLLKTGVTRYLEFQDVRSFLTIFHNTNKKIPKPTKTLI
jgi:Rab GDP dissociation inhibitor